MGCVIISEASIGAVEYCGKFSQIIEPGYHCLVPCFESVRSVKSVNMQVIDIIVDAITEEQLSIKIKVGVQYKIIENDTEIYVGDNSSEMTSISESNTYNTFGSNAYQRLNNTNNANSHKYNAIYSTSNPQFQITQNIEAKFREISCKHTLKELLSSKNKICDVLTKHLNSEMNRFGYMIYRVLIQDIDPPHSVKDTMNMVLSSQNKRDAMINEAEAKKKAAILEAEGMCEVRRLEGVGLANQRKALAEGLLQSVNSFDLRLKRA